MAVSGLSIAGSNRSREYDVAMKETYIVLQHRILQGRALSNFLPARRRRRHGGPFARSHDGRPALRMSMPMPMPVPVPMASVRLPFGRRNPHDAGKDAIHRRRSMSPLSERVDRGAIGVSRGSCK
jgi:hypothetical protein